MFISVWAVSLLVTLRWIFHLGVLKKIKIRGLILSPSSICKSRSAAKFARNHSVRRKWQKSIRGLSGDFSKNLHSPVCSTWKFCVLSSLISFFQVEGCADVCTNPLMCKEWFFVCQKSLCLPSTQFMGNNYDEALKQLTAWTRLRACTCWMSFSVTRGLHG